MPMRQMQKYGTGIIIPRKDQLKRNFDLAVSQVDAGGLFTQVKSESEGIRLVKMTLRHFIKKGQFYYIPKIITQNGAKYIGYRLGKTIKTSEKVDS